MSVFVFYAFLLMSVNIVHVHFYIVSHCTYCISCCVFPSCSIDRMLSTGQHWEAMPALYVTLYPRWSLYSTALTTSSSPCYTVQLKKAMLKWFNF